MAQTKLSFKEQMKGFPVWQIIVIGLVRCAEPIAFTSLFPYVYFMVRDFQIAGTEADIAKYVGYLSSSFAFCQFLFSIHWGHLADLIGRKKVLMTGLISTALALLLFGFATNYYTLLLARSLMGVFNGNVLVIRTVLGEVAVHKRHQAVAFSTLPLLWQAGTIVGPFIGGLLTSVHQEQEYNFQNTFLYKLVAPILNSTSVSTSLFAKLTDKYPYALSNIIVSWGLFNCAIICLLFFEETHEYYKFHRDYGVELGDKLIRMVGIEPPVRPWHRGYPHLLPAMSRGLSSSSFMNRSNSQNFITPRNLSISGSAKLVNDDSETRPLLSSLDMENNPINTYTGELGDEVPDTASINSSASEDSVQSVGPLSRRQSLALIRTYSKRSNLIGEEVLRNQGYDWGVLFIPQVLYSIFSNFALSLSGVVVDEFLPVFLAHKTARVVSGDLSSPLLSKFPFKVIGGLNFDPKEVGNLLSLCGTVGVVLVMFVYPYVDRTFPPVKSFRFFILLLPFVYFVIPLLVFTLPPNTPSMVYTKTFLYLVVFFKVLSQAICFPQVTLLIHRASPAKNRAFVNGTTLSLTSLARSIGPLIWGYVMSFADAHDLGWITWWSMSVVAIFSAVPLFLLKEEYEPGD